MFNCLIKWMCLLSLMISLLSCQFVSKDNKAEKINDGNSFYAEGQLDFEDSNASEIKLNLYWATTDISVGKNRIAFGLTENSIGSLKNYETVIYSFYLSNNKNTLIHEVVNADYYEWPQGRGIYVANMNFDKAGSWGITVSTSSQKLNGEITTALNVNEKSKTPPLYSKALMSVNKTNSEEYKLNNITSDPDPDPDLYSLTISDAIKMDKPLVVAFASPGYCVTKTCGPQVNVLKSLKMKYKDKINFIHVEVYDNLDKIQGDLKQADISQVVLDWGLPSEPWSFLINSEGIIIGKYEGFISEYELEKNIQLVIK